MRAKWLAIMLTLATPLSAQGGNDYETAVAARQAGDAATALVLLDRWLAAHPQDSDALVQRGYAHLALGNRQAAADDFRAALLIAPDYDDARAGLALIAERDEEPSGGYLIAGGAWSSLEAGGQDWWEASLVGEAPLSPALSLGGRASWYRRFGLKDIELEARIAARPADDLWLRASIGGTPAADFRPEIALAGGADLRVTEGTQATVLSIDAAWQRFPLQDIVTVTPGITQYFGDGRWSGTLRGIGIVPENSSLELGVLGRLDYTISERQRLFFGAAYSPDTDLGIVTRVTSAFAGAELPLGDRVSLLPSLAHEWRDGGPDRTELRIELKTAF